MIILGYVLIGIAFIMVTLKFIWEINAIREGRKASSKVDSTFEQDDSVEGVVDYVKELEVMIEEEKKRGLVGHHMTVALASDNASDCQTEVRGSADSLVGTKETE